MFGHLIVYSAYSFSKSTMMISDLVNGAKKANMDALALTDFNHLHGIKSFEHACKKAGIHPVYGMTTSVEVDLGELKLVLLCLDNQGYHDLVRLTSLINCPELFEETYTFETLKKACGHLEVLVPSNQSIFMQSEKQSAVELLSLLHTSFPHLHLCLVDHLMAMEQQNNQQLLSIAHSLNIPCCASNEVAYLKQTDAKALNFLEASFAKRSLTSFNAINDQAYLKTKEEMAQLFSLDLLEETGRILEKCQVDLSINVSHTPEFPLPEGVSAPAYLSALCQKGLSMRFKNQPIPSNYQQRLNYELEVIISMNFAHYFLIVYDYVRFAKKQGILVGAGRGSVCGSLIAYCLGITNIDPIAYGLFFERFLNPDRITMPDIDIDFQDDRRDEVIQYVIDRYGLDHVCQIATFTTWGARTTINELGKVASIPAPILSSTSRMIPNTGALKATALETFNTRLDFQNQIQRYPELKKIMPSVFTIEPLPRNVSIHAAGIVLSKEPLYEVIPLTHGPNGQIISQYDKDYIEEVGLLKMDFLSLRNLTMMQDVIDTIYQTQNIHVDINQIPLNDPATLEMIGNGDTFGIFQLESRGMISLLQQLRVSSFEDVIAAIALYRPGPMENIPHYVARKHHQEPITYIHESLKPILEDTYGIMIYQEQIMRIATTFSNFTLAKADLLRKAVSKKTASLMESMKQEFIQGAISKGYPESIAIQVFDHIERFANYGFNRAHSVAYGVIAMQMAYLKRHYPVPFYAALLSNNPSSDHHKLLCLQEIRKYKVKLLPPSINTSTDKFSVEKGHIRFSLTALKGLGYANYQLIVQERQNGPFKDLEDFMYRIASSKNKKGLDDATITILIDSGALDEIAFINETPLSRRAMRENLADFKQSSGNNQWGLDNLNLDLEELGHYNVKESKQVRLENQKRVLGVYLEAHPIELLRAKIKQPTMQLGFIHQAVNQEVLVVGQITRVREKVDKKQERYAFITLSDETSSMDMVIFSDKYAKYRDQIKENQYVLGKVKVTMRDRLSLTLNQLTPIHIQSKGD